MVGFSKFTQSLWGTQSRRTPPIHPFLLPGLQEETVTACRPCNMWLQGKVWSNLDSIEMTSLCVCSLGVRLCPCGQPPLPSSLKPAHLLSSSPRLQGLQNLWPISYPPEHLETWLSLGPCSAMGTGDPGEGCPHRSPLLLRSDFLLSA